MDLAAGDVTDAQEATEMTIMHAFEAKEHGSAPEGSAVDSDSYECAAAESEEDQVDETLIPNPMKNCTMSKCKKVVLLEPLLPSDDDMPRQQRRKRIHISVQVYYMQLDMPNIS